MRNEHVKRCLTSGECELKATYWLERLKLKTENKYVDMDVELAELENGIATLEYNTVAYYSVKYIHTRIPPDFHWREI